MTATPDWLQLNVSRETLGDLTYFGTLVEKWNPRINLVSKSSLSDIWDRHIWDACQIVDLQAPRGDWVDLGSGGGFPGIIIAIFAKHGATASNVTMIESDQRKSAFLRTAIRELSLPAKVMSERIEAVDPRGANVLSARALADLDQLLGFAERHLAADGTCLFPKGATWQKEVEAARQNWSFDLHAHTSKTNAEAAILQIRNIQRV